MPSNASHRFLVVLLVIFFALLLLTISGYIGPLVVALILAGLTSPFYKKIASLLENKNLAAFLSVLLVSLIIVLPTIFLFTLITKEAIHLFTVAQNGITENYSLQNVLGNLSAKLNIDLQKILETDLAPALKNIGLTISREIGSLLSNALAFGINFFVMIIALFYLLRDGKKFATFLIDLSPLRTADDLDIYHTFRDTGKAVFYGSGASALAQGILGGIGFFFAGLTGPLLWGTLMGFLGLIPFLGPYVIFIPATIYLFLTGQVVTAVIFLIYNILIVSTIDNVIKPKVISDKVRLHPLFVLTAILGGLKFFGIAGLIYGPLILAVFLALLRVYLETQKPTHTHA